MTRRQLARWAWTAAACSSLACADPGPVGVRGTVFDFEQALGLIVDGASARQAHDATLVAGVQVFMAEDALIRSLATGPDGRYEIVDVPSRREWHPIATRIDGFVRSEDGLGLQYPEADVEGYEVGILARGPLVEAVAAGFHMTTDELIAQGFALASLWSAAFPGGELVRSNLQVVPSNGRVVHLGWDAERRAFVTALGPGLLPATAPWLGVLAVTEADGPVRITVDDPRRGPGFPKLYVQHPMTIPTTRAQLFLLHPVN